MLLAFVEHGGLEIAATTLTNALCVNAPRVTPWVSWTVQIIPGSLASKVKQVQEARAELLDGIHHGNGKIKENCIAG